MGQLGDILYTNARIRGAGILDALRDAHYQHKLRLQRAASNAKYEEIDNAWQNGRRSVRQERQAEIDQAVAMANLHAIDALAWKRLAIALNDRAPEDKRLDKQSLEDYARLHRVSALCEVDVATAQKTIASIRKADPKAAEQLALDADAAQASLDARGVRSKAAPRWREKMPRLAAWLEGRKAD